MGTEEQCPVIAKLGVDPRDGWKVLRKCAFLVGLVDPARRRVVRLAGVDVVVETIPLDMIGFRANLAAYVLRPPLASNSVDRALEEQELVMDMSAPPPALYSIGSKGEEIRLDDEENFLALMPPGESIEAALVRVEAMLTNVARLVAARRRGPR